MVSFEARLAVLLMYNIIIADEYRILYCKSMYTCIELPKEVIGLIAYSLNKNIHVRVHIIETR